MVDDRADPGWAKSQEQHAAALVAAQGLHRGIIDGIQWISEGVLDIEPDSFIAQVLGLCS